MNENKEHNKFYSVNQIKDYEMEELNKIIHSNKSTKSAKYIILFLCILFIIILNFLVRTYNIQIQIQKYKYEIDKMKAFINNRTDFKDISTINKNITNSNKLISINEPILPENEKEIIVKEYFKTNFDKSNIRYHFQDLFNNRKLFLIDYSYFPYLEIDKSKSYDENAKYIYQKTGMLNITKLDIFYYGPKDINTSDFNHIHLSMGHDANYILLSLISIASILNTTNNNTYIHFHFVLIDCKFEDMKPIIQLQKINKNVEFIFYNGRQAEYDFSVYGNKEPRGIGDYTKFLIPQIVNNTNKIIILDSADIIAQGDLSEIYYYDLEDNYFGFTLDIAAGKENNILVFAKNKFYGNIGSCLVNIRLFRKDNLYKAGFFVRMAYEKMPCPTQEMFLLISNYKIKYFPLIYNCPQFFDNITKVLNKDYNSTYINHYLLSQKNSPFRYSKEELIEADSKQVIKHIFNAKPFFNKANQENGKIWVNYAKMTGLLDKFKSKFPSVFKKYDS